MFRRLQKQLHDTELGTGSGTTGTRTCTYVQVQWGYTNIERFISVSIGDGTVEIGSMCRSEIIRVQLCVLAYNICRCTMYDPYCTTIVIHV
jgi:hypothetical protein